MRHGRNDQGLTVSVGFVDLIVRYDTGKIDDDGYFIGKWRNYLKKRLTNRRPIRNI